MDKTSPKYFLYLSILICCVSGNEHVQKKKPSAGKFVEDIKRICEHSPIYADVILK